VPSPRHDLNNKTLEEIRTQEETLFLHRNETSLVSLRLLDGGVRVQEAVYGHNYTLRAEISRPDGLYFIYRVVCLYVRQTDTSGRSFGSTIRSILLSPMFNLQERMGSASRTASRSTSSTPAYSSLTTKGERIMWYFDVRVGWTRSIYQEIYYLSIARCRVYVSRMEWYDVTSVTFSLVLFLAFSLARAIRVMHITATYIWRLLLIERTDNENKMKRFALRVLRIFSLKFLPRESLSWSENLANSSSSFQLPYQFSSLYRSDFETPWLTGHPFERSLNYS